MPTYSTMMVMSAQQCKFCLVFLLFTSSLLFLSSVVSLFFLGGGVAQHTVREGDGGGTPPGDRKAWEFSIG